MMMIASMALVKIQFLIRVLNILAPLCGSTGEECIDDCDLSLNGVYQWCGRCDYFLQCSGSGSYLQACQPGLYYDNSVQACVYESTTCHDSPCHEVITTPTTSKYGLQTFKIVFSRFTCIIPLTKYRCVQIKHEINMNNYRK